MTSLRREASDFHGFGSGGDLTILTNDNALHARLQSTSGTFTLIAGAPLQENFWHHVALTFGPEGMRLYLDGQLAASNGYTGGLGTTSRGSGNEEPIALGASTGFSNAHSVAPLSNYFAGALDEVRIYDRALSASEIGGLVNEP